MSKKKSVKYVVFFIPYDKNGDADNFPEFVVTKNGKDYSADSITLNEDSKIKIFDKYKDARSAAQKLPSPKKGDGPLCYHACEYLVLEVPDTYNFNDTSALDLWDAGDIVFSLKKSAK